MDAPKSFVHDASVGIGTRPIASGVATYSFGRSFTDAELEATLDAMKAQLETARGLGQKVVFLSISYEESRMTAKQRKRVAEWIREEDELMRASCAAMSVVVPGAMQRGAFSAVLWLVRYPVPIRAFSTEVEAEAWAASMARAASVATPRAEASGR